MSSKNPNGYKSILVTGTVKLYREKPEIIVESADQIRLVEKK